MKANEGTVFEVHFFAAMSEDLTTSVKWASESKGIKKAKLQFYSLKYEKANDQYQAEFNGDLNDFTVQYNKSKLTNILGSGSRESTLMSLTIDITSQVELKGVYLKVCSGVVKQLRYYPELTSYPITENLPGCTTYRNVTMYDTQLSKNAHHAVRDFNLYPKKKYLYAEYTVKGSADFPELRMIDPPTLLGTQTASLEITAVQFCDTEHVVKNVMTYTDPITIKSTICHPKDGSLPYSNENPPIVYTNDNKVNDKVNDSQ